MLTLNTAMLLLYGMGIVLGMPNLARGKEVNFGNYPSVATDTREPRSFQNFIQETSKKAVSFAKAAVKTFFPSAESKTDNIGKTLEHRITRTLISKKPNHQLVKKLKKKSLIHQTKSIHAEDKNLKADTVKSEVNPDKESAPIATAYTNFPMSMYSAGYVPGYYSGYQAPIVQYPYYGNNYAMQNAYLSKRGYLTYPQTSYGYGYGQYGAASVSQSQDSTATKKDEILNTVDEDADGFSEAVMDMKKAMITNNKDGGINLEEEYQDSKENIFKKNAIEKRKNGKNLIDDFTKVLKSKGDLEDQLLAYFTNYVCGSNC